ncbi:MAG: SDR family NAD(P)-dependent oxidoreductase [Pseudomonadota bacterium]|nr:SDR family NAD(P)-dependent oxidoreductase [Pseudomonadota bacterium]
MPKRLRKLRVAWITGAGKGIGRHLATELARMGWCVAVTARTASDLEELVDEVEELLGDVVPYPGNIVDEDAMGSIVETVERELGQIDLAILNAGTYLRFGVSDFTVKRFGEQISTNTMGTVNCLAPLMQTMMKRRSGQIAVISSLSAYRGLPMASAYGASKAALTNMCEALKPELNEFNVEISVVHPGFVKTPLTDLNQFPMPFLISGQKAANEIILGLEKNRFEISFPKRLSVIMKLLRYLPDKLYFSITRRMIKK